jgi:hypothetical protein
MGSLGGEDASTACEPRERGECEYSHTKGEFEGQETGCRQSSAAGSAFKG